MSWRRFLILPFVLIQIDGNVNESVNPPSTVPYSYDFAVSEHIVIAVAVDDVTGSTFVGAVEGTVVDGLLPVQYR